MSWIVQNLWNNREKIKTKSRRNNGIAYSFSLLYDENKELLEESVGYDDPFIESDEFNDLLIVEKAIEELRELNLLSEGDLKVLYGGRKLLLTRNQKYTLDKKLYYICERIAYYLGGYFTDEGYIDYLTKKYNLSQDQQEIARVFMRSKFKNKILNKGYRIENNENLTIISAEV